MKLETGDYCETQLRFCKVVPTPLNYPDHVVCVQFRNGKSGLVRKEELKKVQITDCTFNGTVWEAKEE